MAESVPGRGKAGAKALRQRQDCEGGIQQHRRPVQHHSDSQEGCGGKTRMERWAGPEDAVGKDLISRPRAVGSYRRICSWE